MSTPPTVADPRLEVHCKPAVATLRLDSKPLADWRREIGRAVERALVLARLTKQEASYEMGYPAGDQSAISRWIAGVDRPQFDKLFAIEALRPWLAVALAELTDADVATTITVRRVA